MSRYPEAREMTGLEIAIVGMSGRFPRARNVEEFWRNLRDGVECITFFTDEELLASGVDPVTLKDPSFVKAGGVLDDPEMFDAAFFGFNPREAEITDPQQRIFLECAWEALEDAGYDPQRFDGAVGVYGGVGMSSYLINIFPTLAAGGAGGVLPILNNDKDFLATRVSYKLNLEGPSLSVQTACSTSLVAVHLARQGLLSGECDMALAGGVKVTVPHRSGYFYQEGSIHSPDGHCRAFDAGAQGSVGGSGAGVVVLRRLEDALANGDSVRAVILGSAINNDGSLKVGYTAPSESGQFKAIRAAQMAAEINPETIGYVEGHGTGTALGDPVEVRALTKAFRASTRRNGFCALGSVKTNVGHLDAAAGVAGLIKATLALSRGELPPTLHFQSPNPQIDFASSPFFVNPELRAWERPEGGLRRAGVSSFGVGGTNAHAVLEEAPPAEASGPSRPSQLLVLSARTDSALDAATANLTRFLRGQPGVELADVAYTLHVGRRAFGRRRALVCRDAAEGAAALEALDPRKVVTGVGEAKPRRVAFMFTGQGAQYAGMGAGLYEAEPAFRRHVDECAEVLRPLLGLDLRGVLFADEAGRAEADERLRQTALTQPALFAVEYALAKLWMSWGVKPAMMIGHSVGEYVAACLAGVFTLEDALAVVAERGRLMQSLPHGAMLSVSLSEEELLPLLGEGLSLAAVNSPALCVAAGVAERVEELEAQLTSRGVGCRRLVTSHAFHSESMEPAVDAFRAAVGRVRREVPRVPFVSNLSGTWITEEEAVDPGYWARHLRETVRFGEGVKRLFEEEETVLVEVGPGRTLTTLARSHTGKASTQVVLSSLPRAEERGADTAAMLESLGRLWVSGVGVDWEAFYAGERRRRLPLPTYPFDRQRYWIDREQGAGAVSNGEGSAETAADVGRWFYVPSWKRTLPAESDAAVEAENGEGSPLVFDDGVIGPRLLSLLRERGFKPTRVVEGRQFAREDDDTYAVAPGAREDYRRLIGELAERRRLPRKVLHLWSRGAEAEGAPVANDSFDARQRRELYSLLYLVQSLSEFQGEAEVEVQYVVSGTHDVIGTELLRPEKSPASGLARVVSDEYPRLTCRLVDVDAGGAPSERLASQLTSELTAGATEAAVAYRGPHRWAQTFEPLSPSDAPAASGRLKENGVYLIAGRGGEVEVELAEYLIRAVKARVALISPTPLPPREAWGLPDDAASDTRLASALKRIADAEAQGGQLLTVVADIRDGGQVGRALLTIKERAGSPDGLVYAAGYAGRRPRPSIGETDVDEFARYFQTGVLGLHVLEQALEGEPLDFCLLLSGAAALPGEGGAGAHAAANAYLEAVAQERNRGAGAWTCVSLDGSGKDFGPAETREIFRRLFARKTTGQVLVSPLRPDGRAARRARQERPEESAPTAPPPQPAAATHRRPDIQSQYVEPRNEVEQAVAALFREFLGFDRVGVDDDLFELGGDSLMATRLLSRVQQVFQVDVALGRFFERPTVAGAALLVAEKQLEMVDEGTLAGMMADLEHLSEEEMRLMLESEAE